MFRYALLCRDYVHTVVFTPRWCYHLRVTTSVPWCYHLGICTRSSLFRIISCSGCKLAANRRQYSKLLSVLNYAADVTLTYSRTAANDMFETRIVPVTSSRTSISS